MYGSSFDYRRGSGIKHPRYGLYLDTHRGEHNGLLVLVGTRVLMLLTLVMAVVVVLAALGPWLTAT